VSLWKNGLKAQKIMFDGPYEKYPETTRFVENDGPCATIGYYLKVIWAEGAHRGIKFRQQLIANPFNGGEKIQLINVSAGQMDFESRLLQNMLRKRSLETLKRIEWKVLLDSHPLFTITSDPNVEPWEKV
jgi:hypothetical protein